MREITKKKFILDNRRPFDPKVESQMRELYEKQWIYSSNILSGYDLSMEETEKILNGQYIVERTIEEHIAVRNMHDGIESIYKMAGKDGKLSYDELIKISQYFSIDEELLFRKDNPMMEQYSYIPKKYADMEEVLRKYVYSFDALKEDIDIITKAVVLHHKFIEVHPFVKCNSRIARALLNYELMKAGYMPITFDFEKEQYENGVKEFMGTGKIEGFSKLIEEQLIKRLDELLEITEL